MGNKFSNPIVVGRVITDPILECKNASKIITSFKLSDTNSSKPFHIISHGKTASICKQYLHIGSLCCVEGKYSNSNDSIIADRITFLKQW